MGTGPKATGSVAEADRYVHHSAPTADERPHRGQPNAGTLFPKAVIGPPGLVESREGGASARSLQVYGNGACSVKSDIQVTEDLDGMLHHNMKVPGPTMNLDLHNKT